MKVYENVKKKQERTGEKNNEKISICLVAAWTNGGLDVVNCSERTSVVTQLFLVRGTVHGSELEGPPSSPIEGWKEYVSVGSE